MLALSHRQASLAIRAFNVETAAIKDSVRGNVIPGKMRMQWWKDSLAGAASIATLTSKMPRRTLPCAYIIVAAEIQLRLHVVNRPSSAGVLTLCCLVVVPCSTSAACDACVRRVLALVMFRGNRSASAVPVGNLPDARVGDNLHFLGTVCSPYDVPTIPRSEIGKCLEVEVSLNFLPLGSYSSMNSKC